MVQLRRKHFNTEVRPIEVTFPKHIMKKKNGISYTNVKYIIQEDEEDLLDYLAKFPDPESLIWGTSEIVENAVSAEEHYWQRLMVRMGYDQKYSHNSRLIKNIHSIKSLTFTAAVEAVMKHLPMHMETILDTSKTISDGPKNKRLRNSEN